MSDIELIRQIDRLEKRLDALVFPEISKGGGGDPATIDISYADFYEMFAWQIGAYGFTPDADDEIGSIYPYSGTHTGSTITVLLYWITAAANPGDVVFVGKIGAQAVGEILSFIPLNTETVTDTASGVGFEIHSTTFTFTEAHEPEDVIVISIQRLGTDSGDTFTETVLPISATIKFS